MKTAVVFIFIFNTAFWIFGSQLFLISIYAYQDISKLHTVTVSPHVDLMPKYDVADVQFWKINLVEKIGWPYSSNLVHVHHGCLNGNGDGIYLFNRDSNTQLLDSKKEKFPTEFRFLNESSIEILYRTCGTHSTRASTCPRIVRGQTYLCNCWRQRPTSTNPMHLLHQVANIYELASVHSTITGKMPTNASIPTFDNIALHQCPSYSSLDDKSWRMGAFLWSLGQRILDEGGLINPRSSVVDLSTSSDWVCFEDIYIDRRYGNVAPAHDLLPNWRSSILKALGYNSDVDTIAPNSVARRCNARKLRIHIYQRRPGDGKNGDRAFQNLEEVLKVAQNYTKERVLVLTTHGGMIPKEQAQVFRDFDILITPHGSHLMNMIFEFPNTGIIEVGPVNHDLVFLKGARQLGIQSYRISTGHDPVMDRSDGDTVNFTQTLATHCTYDSEDGLGWVCPRPISFQYVVLDMVVNLNKLRYHIENTMNSLCYDL